MARLAGRVALVTGAASGIGRAVARAFAAEGAAVHAADVRADALGALVEGLRIEGLTASSSVADISVPEVVEGWVANVLDASGRIDCLANVAGVISSDPVEELSVAEWDRILGINLRGTFLCARAVAPAMKRLGSGSIINVSSRAGTMGFAGMTAYCASKFGVEGLSRALAKELGPHGIAVNTITPGTPVHTAMSEITYSAAHRKVWQDPRGHRAGLRPSRPPGAGRTQRPLRQRLGARAGARSGRRPMKAVLLDPTGPDDVAFIGEFGPGIDLVAPDSPGGAADALLAGAAAIVSRRVPVTDEHMDAAGPSLRLVQLCSTRRDRVDLEAARARGVPVALMPQRGCIAVAEQTLLLMLGLSKKVVRAHEATAGGEYRELGVDPIRTEERLHRFQWMRLPGHLRAPRPHPRPRRLRRDRDRGGAPGPCVRDGRPLLQPAAAAGRHRGGGGGELPGPAGMVGPGREFMRCNPSVMIFPGSLFGDCNEDFLRISLLQPVARIEAAVGRMAATVAALASPVVPDGRG